MAQRSTQKSSRRTGEVSCHDEAVRTVRPPISTASRGDDRAAANLDGFSPQFASFGGTDGAQEHAEELQADRGGELPRRGGDDRAAADLDGFSPQFASFGGTDGAEEHTEELQADRGGELPRRGGDDRAAANFDGFSPQFASFGGTDGAEEHAEEWRGGACRRAPGGQGR
ncbi:unnamed protein product [Effrenium voratum]|nr:unnamed protein product [Effrenium voratum]